MESNRKRCGLKARHMPHWHKTYEGYKWCDGKPPYEPHSVLPER